MFKIKRKGRRLPAAAGLTAAVLLAGCSAPAGGDSTAGPGLKPLGKDEKATIKVTYFNKTSLYSQYGNLFISKFPNIELEAVSTQGLYTSGQDYKKAFADMLDKEKPDVLMINANDLEELSQDGRLLALDDLIKQDKFDADQIDASVMELIKSKGGGKIYALSPTFYGNALYYNKDLFDKYGVPLPQHQMSWDDVLQLARRFPTDGQGDSRVYGLSAYSYNTGMLGYTYMNAIGQTNGLQYLDPNAMKITFQTDGWRKALQLTVDALKSDAVYAPKSDNGNAAMAMSYESYLTSNPFTAGHAAMTIDGSYLMNNLQQAKEQVKDYKAFNWDTVTVPVNPQDPNVSNGISVSNLFAVSAAASNPRAAWEFVKYVNSDEMARIQSKSTQDLLTRPAYMKERDGHSLEAFFKLKPNTSIAAKEFEKIPQTFYMSFSQMANQEIQQSIDGKQSVDEALKAMEQKGQEALTKAKQEEDAKNDAAAK